MTLALPAGLLRRVKVIAAARESSISAMLTAALRQIADQEQGYEVARRRMLADLPKGFNLGTHGKIAWSRGSLHERQDRLLSCAGRLGGFARPRECTPVVYWTGAMAICPNQA